MTTRKAMADKVLVLGVDGFEPRYAKKLMDAGKMPNLKKYVERGAQREDLVLLGSNPTVTPPQWTTLACGCNPNVHSITQFFRHNPDDYDYDLYNIDSRNCKAEPIWNVTAEAGKKTCVFHWPGSSWPPTSDNPNLMVVDGSAPGAVGMAMFQTELEFFFGANENIKEARFLPAAASDLTAPCVVNELESEGKAFDMGGSTGGGKHNTMNMDETDGNAIGTGGPILKYNAVQSYIRPATGWANAPEDAKEFMMLTSEGLVRRPGLILKNENGVYDHVAIYKSKKDVEPLVVCYVDKIVGGVVDENFKGEKKHLSNRNYLLLEVAEDGSKVRMFVSGAYDIENDGLFHPKSLHKALLENAGPFPPSSLLFVGGKSLDAIKCMLYCWDVVAEWYSKAIHYLIDQEGVEVLMSHYHAIDLQEHTFIRLLKDHGKNTYTEDEYEECLIKIYQQTDNYLGTFLHYLDEGWTIIITSDHGQVCSYNEAVAGLGDMNCHIGVPFMEELGYTVVKRDENGNRLREIDWSKTRAYAEQGNDIFLNIKGRGNQGRGIVDPEDQYELEEQIMTDLYGYRDKKTGKRVVALALRNKDAVLLGYGGPTAGDICYWTAEGYNWEHCDSLSTCYGARETSVSPIFVAAGKGLKEGFTTDRIIRQVDVAPTISALLGLRMPAQCEGAPAYQILAEEF